jgi:hypothetical protein
MGMSFCHISEVIMYIVVTNPIFESHGVVSCSCYSRPMEWVEAQGVMVFANHDDNEAWMLDLESGNWTPPPSDEPWIEPEPVSYQGD